MLADEESSIFENQNGFHGVNESEILNTRGQFEEYKRALRCPTLARAD